MGEQAYVDWLRVVSDNAPMRVMRDARRERKLTDRYKVLRRLESIRLARWIEARLSKPPDHRGGTRCSVTVYKTNRGRTLDLRRLCRDGGAAGRPKCESRRKVFPAVIPMCITGMCISSTPHFHERLVEAILA